MKTFLEAVRSKERAKKLLDYMSKRWGSDWEDMSGENRKQIPISKKSENRLNDKHVGLATRRDKKATPAEPKKHKTTSLKPTQKYVDVETVRSKIDKHDRIPVASVSSKEGHHILDGHHRHFASRLLGRKSISAYNTKIKEEAPVNNVGDGNIAGAGVGPNGMPGVSKRNQKKHQNKVLRRTPPRALNTGVFWGKTTLKVPSSMIHECRVQKVKGKWWTTYLGESDVALAIREWANANPDSPVILEDDIGNICIVRYSKDKY